MKKILITLLILSTAVVKLRASYELTDEERDWVRQQTEARVSKTSLTADFDRIMELEKQKELEKSLHATNCAKIIVMEYYKDGKEIIRHANQVIMLNKDVVTAAEDVYAAAEKNSEDARNFRIDENLRHGDSMKALTREQVEASSRIMSKDYPSRKLEEAFYTKIALEKRGVLLMPKTQSAEDMVKEKMDEIQKTGFNVNHFRGKR